MRSSCRTLGTRTEKLFDGDCDKSITLDADNSSEKMVEKPSTSQLRRVFMTAMIPFIGFGIVDNAVMVK